MNIALLLAVATCCTFTCVNAFFGSNCKLPQTTPLSKPSSSSLHMVFGPKQALAMEKMKNPEAYERTIQNLMKTKKLTRSQAEARYGTFLLDPDGFALNAAAEQRKEKGYKDWKEQAIMESDDPEATRKRIDEFQKRNSLKGTAIIVLGASALLYFKTLNPYIPPSAGI